ncbi:MAG TPA: N-acetyltransferase [Persephonella sp.]|uniref:N-acetyltransferase, gnat family n=1 Tax=Persephonella marina (strain DSM 14350 / EX-H1) TaxID=123214 RepID=C0QT10_PERMH|nr:MULTISPECIES: GNAT family N-acetyltransferase [Persephonella]ACO04416.1 N-acetyltransferase, gnat family [Persephonella marina EX-H1]HCB70556.1 N-acetyltransferase [Persephonella sp.]
MEKKGNFQEKDKVKLKNYSDSYKKELINALFEAYLDLPEYGEPSYKSAKRYINWLKNHSTLFKVAFYNGEIAGFVVADANWKDLYGRDVGEIHELAVRKKFWGKGIGKTLLEEALKHLKEKGKKEIGLWVGRKNRKAIEFYKKYGFKIEESYRDWLRMVRRE